MALPFAPACERNRDPILRALKTVFADSRKVLEIGSGTGQHAVYFGPQLPHLQWQTSELPENHAAIQGWLAAHPSANVLPPLLLDMSQADWSQAVAPGFDAVFSANTSHIMAWPQVENMFAGFGALLPPGGLAVVYGPFNDNGLFTSEGNARFDQALRNASDTQGLRDWQAVDALALRHGLHLMQNSAMPANNRLLVWRRD